MKLFSLVNSVALASLFSTMALATIELEDLPSTLDVGSTYEVKWSADTDYVLEEFILVKQTSGGWSPWRHSGKGTLFKDRSMPAGNDSILWTVPEIKNDRGHYALWLSGGLLPEERVFDPALNSTVDAYAALTNWFEVEGGPTLYPEEIAGVVVGTLVALVVVGVVGWFVARVARKKKAGVPNPSGDAEDRERLTG